VAALTDVNGTFVEYYEYNVFGEPAIWDVNTMEIVESSVVGNPYMFTGREYDSETGLYYYRARYYSPKLGRFLQTDPIRYRAGLNLYSYCGNNPIMWIDAFGLMHYGYEETQQIINEGRTSPYNPLRHSDYSDTGWDFSYGPHEKDTYEPRPGMKMSSSSFGNYMAGYMGTYHAGDLGYFGARAVGNSLENARASGKWWHGYNIFWGDDEDSIRDINRGNEDAEAQKYKDYAETGKAIADIVKSESERLGNALKDRIKGKEKCKK
jgi:RHS repeat-associated protein